MRYAHLFLAALVAVTFSPGRASASGERITPLSCAEHAVPLIAEGNYRDAANFARQAVQIAPDDSNVSILAGTVLLNTGDSAGALAAFKNGLSANPGDRLALYGQGLALLALGDRRGAARSFDDANAGDNGRPALQIARSYISWLDGGRGPAGGADIHIPEALKAAFKGYTAVRAGDGKAATAALEAAQAGTPGDPIVQPDGPLFTFDAARPIVEGAPPVQPPGGLNPATGREKGVAGDILFTPEGLTPSVAYVAYDLDGQALSLVGTHPFQYSWNSRLVANGWHTVTVVLFGADVREISRVSRRLRVANRAVATPGDSDAWRSAREALWDALTPRLDRCACAYAIGKLYRSRGRIDLAKVWFARTVAIRPEFRDARQQFADCGGLQQPRSALYSGPANEKIVALTFDDGPRPGVTEPLLDLLTEQRVPATFFVIGRHVTDYPELARRIVSSGMEIGNHTYRHPDLTRISPDMVARELLETQAAVLSVTGKLPRFMRPPGGNWNSAVAETVRRWGLTPCMWTVDAFNSEVIGTKQVVDAVLEGVRPGSIILMHDGKVTTLQALPAIIRELRARGFVFVTVDALERRTSVAGANVSPGTGPSPRKGE